MISADQPGSVPLSHVDPVDLVGHRDRVPGELAVEALLLLLPLAVELGVLLLRPEQLPVTFLALAVVPRLLLRHAVADRPVALDERVGADGRHPCGREHADQRELPGEVADQGQHDDQRGQHEHERAHQPHRPVQHVFLEPLAAQQRGPLLVVPLGDGRLLRRRRPFRRRARVGMRQDVLPAQVDAVGLELRVIGMHVRHVTPLRLRYVVLFSLRSVTAYELQPLLRQGSRQFRQLDGRNGVSGTRLTYYHH
ncbi:hypothetical protein ACFSTC_52595 [Nonomuraea ferruginea]